MAQKAVTRTATIDDLRDLLIRVPHANLAFVADRTVVATPVSFVSDGERYWLGLADDRVEAGQAVMLLIDEGSHYFDLRGLRIRGHTRPAHGQPARCDPALRWLELDAEKVIAWDYALLRRTATS